MDTQNNKQILDEAVHKFVESIIRYVYDITDYSATDECLHKMNDAKDKYYY